MQARCSGSQRRPGIDHSWFLGDDQFDQLGGIFCGGQTGRNDDCDRFAAVPHAVDGERRPHGFVHGRTVAIDEAGRARQAAHSLGFEFGRGDHHQHARCSPRRVRVQGAYDPVREG